MLQTDWLLIDAAGLAWGLMLFWRYCRHR